MRYMLKFFLATLFFFGSLLEASHKIVYLISPPRSLSVSLSRMFHARGDFDVYIEPSMLSYVHHSRNDYALPWFDQHSFTDFGQVKKELLAASDKMNVFVKEMSFSLEPFLLNDKELLQNEQVHFVFLARNPHHSAISFFNKDKEQFPAFVHLLGYESLYNIAKKVEAEAKNKPLFILTEDLYTNPEGTIQSLCSSLGIPYKPEALHWEGEATPDTLGPLWHEYKVPDRAVLWHGEAFQSSGFGKPKQYALDADGNPTFEEIEDPDDRAFVVSSYLYNLHFYNLLLVIGA